MIKAIVFDFGGVISPGIVLPWVKSLPKTDPRYTVFEEASLKWDLGDMTVDGFYEALSKITGKPSHILKESFYDNATFHPEVIHLIKKLKKRYKIAIFSNNFAHNIYKYFEQLSLKHLFDEIIISSEHKMKKPDASFYQKLLSILDLKPEEVIFIDDTQENVDAGNKLGITSFLFTEVEKLKTDLKSKGVL